MLEIEIVDSNLIEGGIEIFARAWRDGEQIGFGDDGSIDIERFRIFNPPIFVDDPNGDVVSYATQKELENDTLGLIIPSRRLREDPEEAILQSLEQTIKQIARFGSERIVAGKRGNTTSTFYSDSNAEDGEVLYGRSTWSTVRNAATGTSSSDAGTQPRFQSGNNNLSTGWENWRAFIAFDTSAIPDGDTISSATLSLRGTNKIDNGDKSACLVSASPASATALVVADYDQVGSVDLAPRIDITAWSTSGFNDFALNASGLANISKTGVSFFGLRSSADLDDDISGIGRNQYATVLFYANEISGTSNDPKLVVEHTAGAGATFLPRVIFY